MKRVIGLLCLLPQLLQAQSIPVKDYPQGYFRNPLNIPIILAGNFGELRPNHFHSGMDIKTQQKENLPVHAAADGYVSRIGVSHTGFGNVLYITHPNGYTTVYAHLNAFFPALQQYVKKQQYQAESWASDLAIPAGMFRLKRATLLPGAVIPAALPVRTCTLKSGIHKPRNHSTPYCSGLILPIHTHRMYTASPSTTAKKVSTNSAR